MINWFFKYALIGALIMYLYHVIRVFSPLFEEDFKDRDYYNLILDSILLLLFPFSVLSATKKYINIVLKAPELLCDHDYKEFAINEVDGAVLKYQKCTKCDHILVTASKKEDEDANIC